VNNMFFWIIVLSFLIPIGMRMYRRSVQKRGQGRNFSGQYPDQFPGSYQGPPNNQPRDGYTQQDYLSGGFGLPPGGQQQLPPLDPPYPAQPYPNSQYPGAAPSQPGSMGPGYQGQGYQGPGYQGPGYQGQVPYQDSPEFNANPSRPQHSHPQPGAAPSTPPPPSAPQGFRARKLAELDQQYSNGEISMEEYMTRRNDIMNG
jgi:hypothetical protein